MRKVAVPESETTSRDSSLDLLRAIACLMIVTVHAGEAYYISHEGKLMMDNLLGVNLFGSFTRMAVPLFAMLTGYFLLPLRESMGQFYKKRLPRVIYPFLIWGSVYALYPFIRGEYGLGEALQTELALPLQYPIRFSHLWYVYMIVGLYLFLPVLSSWIERATLNEKYLFLGIWFLSLFVRYLKLLSPEILGEAYWNDYTVLYYFSGYAGYAVLGHLIKTESTCFTRHRISLGIVLTTLGYVSTGFLFWLRTRTETDTPNLELGWNFDTPNYALCSLGIFLLLMRVKVRYRWGLQIIRLVSDISYGIYLAHILALSLIAPMITTWLPNPGAGIPILGIITFLVTGIGVTIISLFSRTAAGAPRRPSP